MNASYNVPVYSANVYEPSGKINSLLISDFSIPSVIWGIDGDWMVNTIEANRPFYPTDHCGVLRVKSDIVLPKVLAHLLEVAGNKVGFKRSYRASMERVGDLSIIIPPIEAQKKAVETIESYESTIAQARAIMDGCAARKQAILDKYLK